MQKAKLTLGSNRRPYGVLIGLNFLAFCLSDNPGKVFKSWTCVAGGSENSFCSHDKKGWVKKIIFGINSASLQQFFIHAFDCRLIFIHFLKFGFFNYVFGSDILFVIENFSVNSV